MYDIDPHRIHLLIIFVPWSLERASDIEILVVPGLTMVVSVGFLMKMMNVI